MFSVVALAQRSPGRMDDKPCSQISVMSRAGGLGGLWAGGSRGWRIRPHPPPPSVQDFAKIGRAPSVELLSRS